MDHVLDVYETPFIWGLWDCCTSACDVFALMHGVDPMAPLRWLYRTRTEALALIRQWGGWRRMFVALTALAGLSEGVGAEGELGLVKTEAGFTLATGIGGDWWAVKMDCGFKTVPGAILCRKL